MPLIELVPPSTLPRGWYIVRPLSSASGSLSKRQLTLGSTKVFAYPIGVWIQKLLSSPPASSNSTR